MRAISRKMLRSLCLLGLGYIGLHLGYSHSAFADMGCSNATLQGTYLFAYSDFQIVDGQQVPFVFAGQDRINGDGTLTGVNSFSVNGAISKNVTDTGTYTINPDCTGTSTTVDDRTGETVHFDLFIGCDGDAVSFVQTDPGFVAASIEQRVGR